MSANSQADQKLQVNSGGASKHDVPVSVGTDAIHIEGDRITVSDPELVKALQERQEKGGSGEEDLDSRRSLQELNEPSDHRR